MLIVLSCIILFLSLDGNNSTERTILNIGYGILVLVLLAVFMNFVIVTANAITALCEFCKKSKKKENKYTADPDSEMSTEHPMQLSDNKSAPEK